MVTPVSCAGGDDGAAIIEVSGGTPPYLYTWDSNPPQYANTATGLIAGVYQVSVTDLNDCSLGPINVTVGEPSNALSATIISSIDPCCFGGNDGVAVVNASGGVPSYSSGNVGPNAL